MKPKRRVKLIKLLNQRQITKQHYWLTFIKHYSLSSSTTIKMAVPYSDLDPYEELAVSNTDDPAKFRKAYLKLSLKYHPDKYPVNITEAKKEEYRVKLDRAQFSYALLSDPKSRARFDRTGSLESSGVDDDDFDWSDFFQTMKADVEITPEVIAQDKKKYQNSEDEVQDIVEAMHSCEGDFPQLFEVIPHLEFSAAEERRIMGIVEQLEKDGKLYEGDDELYPKLEKYRKNRDKNVRRLLKKSKQEENEAKEAEKMLKEISKKHNVKVDDSEDSLKALIQAKQGKKQSVFERLFAKYDKPHRSSSSKQTGKKKRTHDDLDDAEFEKIQQKMFKKKDMKGKGKTKK